MFECMSICFLLFFKLFSSISILFYIILKKVLKNLKISVEFYDKVAKIFIEKEKNWFYLQVKTCEVRL